MAKRTKAEEEAIRDAVRSRAGGRCECTSGDCAHHSGRCSVQLGSRWDVRKKNPKRPFNVLNLEGLCVRCHRNARVRGEES